MVYSKKVDSSGVNPTSTFNKGDIDAIKGELDSIKKQLVKLAVDNPEHVVYVRTCPVSGDKLRRPLIVTSDGDCYIVTKKHKSGSAEPIDSQLGTGVQKRVWDSFHLDSKAEVALLEPKTSKNRKEIEGEYRFLREIFDDVFFVSYQGSHEEKSLMIQKKYDSDLSKLDFSTLSLDKKVEIIKQLTKQLIKMKEKRIIHNDIKPENILIDSDGNSRLADFGVARFEQENGLWKKYHAGNACYRSPESFKSDPSTSFPKDMWAMGLIFSEIAWNHSWEKHLREKGVTNPFALKKAVVGFSENWHETEFPKTKYSSGNDQLDALIRKTLEVDPSKRITPEEFLSEIESITK